MGVPTVTQDTALEVVPRRSAPGPSVPGPAARVRRLLASAPGGPTDPGTALLAAALARFEAPADLRVRGGLGSGRRTLATALRARRGWRVTVEDLDVIAAAGAVSGATPTIAPDVEIICLRTAPCRHEEAWVRRPRRHPMMVVATGMDDGRGAGAGAGGVGAGGVSAGGAGTGGVSTDGVSTDEAAEAGDRDDDEVAVAGDPGPVTTRRAPSRPAWARGLPAVDARDPEDRSVDSVVAFVERALDALPTVRLARLEVELERLAVHPEIGELAEAALCALDLS